MVGDLQGGLGMGRLRFMDAPPPWRHQAAMVWIEKGRNTSQIPHLVLCEQDKASDEDVDNVSQTRVLEKFGNLTSKKQERPSLKRSPEQ